jgi:hypothetical protein
MSAEDRSGKVSTDEECTDVNTSERSFDAIARGVAKGTVSRRKALHFLAVGLVGSALGFGPSVASAAPTAGVSKCQPLGHKCLTNIDCCSRFCDKNGNQCACTPDEIACQDPSSGQLRCVPRCASGLGPCKIDACNPSTGQCVVANADGAPCEDGDLCTVGDQCQNGTCQPGRVTVCDQCFRCEPTTGICEVDPDQVGDSCNDNDPCTENDQCTATGTCVGTPKVCPTAGQVCVSGTCQCPAGTCGTNCTGTVCITPSGTVNCCTGANQTCCAPGTAAPGQCRRVTGTACSSNNQCCSGSCPTVPRGVPRVCA